MTTFLTPAPLHFINTQYLDPTSYANKGISVGKVLLKCKKGVHLTPVLGCGVGHPLGRFNIKMTSYQYGNDRVI